jgi:protein-S-isoprenylcysteine O-methyltransferase Ste14
MMRLLEMKPHIIKRFTQVVIILSIQLLCLFTAAGSLSWFWARLYVLVSILLLLFNFMVLPSAVIEERGTKKQGVKRWDKILNNLNIIPTLLMYVFCGLDYRFGWSAHQAISLHVAGFGLYVLGSLLFSWSMYANPFFSVLVRIQSDRGHTVSSAGPYKMIRHPGYLAYILMSLMIPVALGTLSGLVFSVTTGLLFVIRTALEDKTLGLELYGYEAYAEQVRYRLLPGIW